MQYMILRRADPASELSPLPASESAQLRATLQPSAKAVRLTLGEGEPVIEHGPFLDPAEMIAGFGVVEAESVAAAAESLRQWPTHTPVEIEIRESGCPGGCAEVHPAKVDDPQGKRFAVLLRASDELENEVPVPQVKLDTLDRHNASEAARGILLAADGLRSSARGARVKVGKGSFSVMDGPFTEIKEMIAGYWLIRVASMDEAIAWAVRNPYPTGPKVEVEIRELVEDGFTAAQLKADQNMRASQLDMAMRAELAGRTA
ncbi:MAG: YciI family protein [Pseudomonadota bacterium]